LPIEYFYFLNYEPIILKLFAGTEMNSFLTRFERIFIDVKVLPYISIQCAIKQIPGKFALIKKRDILTNFLRDESSQMENLTDVIETEKYHFRYPEDKFYLSMHPKDIGFIFVFNSIVLPEAIMYAKDNFSYFLNGEIGEQVILYFFVNLLVKKCINILSNS
jgi:hypothetical protein